MDPIQQIRDTLLTLEAQAQTVVINANAAYTTALQGKKDAKTVRSLDPGRHRHFFALIQAARAQGDLLVAAFPAAPTAAPAPVSQVAGQPGVSEPIPNSK